MTICLYCGIGEMDWNHHPVRPGPYACISPVYGSTIEGRRINRVSVPQGTAIIQDSGAFSDGPSTRLSFEGALARQEEHAKTYKYRAQIIHRASYDLLIDEKWQNGRRTKARWTESDAEMAVEETVKAARYLSLHRSSEISCVLSAQGVSPQQYLTCARQITPFLDVDAGDMFGLGGWCVTGKYPKVMLPVFRETMRLVIPFLAREGVRRVHIWGVCYVPALHILAWLCQEHGLALSTDSMGPSLKPVKGEWGYSGWRNPDYKQPPILDSCRLGEHDRCIGCRGLERARHVAATRAWLTTFQPKPPGLEQLSLLGVYA